VRLAAPGLLRRDRGELGEPGPKAFGRRAGALRARCYQNASSLARLARRIGVVPEIGVLGLGVDRSVHGLRPLDRAEAIAGVDLQRRPYHRSQLAVRRIQDYGALLYYGVGLSELGLC